MNLLRSLLGASTLLLSTVAVLGLAPACGQVTPVLTTPEEAVSAPDASSNPDSASSPDGSTEAGPVEGCQSEPDVKCCGPASVVAPTCENNQLVCQPGFVKATGGCPVAPGAISCAAAGGTCGAISDCDRGEGQVGASKYTCGGGAPGTDVCCFKPPTACGAAADFDCCLPNDGVARPTCEDNVLVCPPLSDKAAVGQCKGG